MNFAALDSEKSEFQVIDILEIEQSINSLMAGITFSSLQDVEQYVEHIRVDHPDLNQQELAKIIVDQQSFFSGFWGAVTSLGGLPLLPITLPLDIIKSWKIQGFMIKSIAYLYGYPNQNTDLKMAIFRLISKGSLAELKQFVIAESGDAVGDYTWSTLEALKRSVIQLGAQEVPKYAAQTLPQCSEKVVRTLGMKEVSQHLSEILCQAGAKKVAEQLLENSLQVAVPVLGAAIGGSIDWLTTQAIGCLAIEVFESARPEFGNSAFNLQLQQKAASLPLG
jgi:hypothetical protein